MYTTAFRAADGHATMVLVDDQSLARLPAAFEASPEYLEHVARKLGGRRGLFYVTPPRFALRCRREVLGEELAAGKVRVELIRVPGRVTAPRATLEVRVTNGSDGVCWTQFARDRRPLHVSYHLLQNGRMVCLDGGRSRLPGSLLGPGESRETSLAVTLPPTPGEYVLEIRPVVEMVGWGGDARRVGVVISRDEGGYAAELKVLESRAGHAAAEVARPVPVSYSSGGSNRISPSKQEPFHALGIRQRCHAGRGNHLLSLAVRPRSSRTQPSRARRLHALDHGPGNLLSFPGRGTRRSRGI